MAKQSTARTEFRAKRWLRLLVTGIFLFLLAGLAFSYRREGIGWQTLAFAVFSVMGLLAVVESIRVRVSLLDDAVVITSLRGRRHIPREAIEDVTWEAGSGVALRLREGTWVKLPEMGENSQGLANSIRAWLRRTGRGT